MEDKNQLKIIKTKAKAFEVVKSYYKDLDDLAARLQADYAADFEGYQYPYFEKEENRIAYRAGDTDWWWLRSPYLADSRGFCNVNYYGDALDSWATNGDGVRPAFCL